MIAVGFRIRIQLAFTNEKLSVYNGLRAWSTWKWWIKAIDATFLQNKHVSTTLRKSKHIEFKLVISQNLASKWKVKETRKNMKRAYAIAKTHALLWT